MLPDEEEKIKKQIRVTEEIVDTESSQYDIDNPRSPRESNDTPIKREDEADKPIKRGDEEAQGNGEAHQQIDGKETDMHSPEDSKLGDTNSDSVAMPGAPSQRHEQSQPGAKDNGDDGGDEVVEGEEDTVIY